MKRFCKGCGRDISHRTNRAVYCERRQCYYNDRYHQHRDEQARDAAGALALRVAADGMKATVVHTALHGWCVRATLPHGPDVLFADEDDLRFFQVDQGIAA